jgi:hypothetical protein
MTKRSKLRFDINKMSQEQKKLINNPEYFREFIKLKDKYPIPKGKRLEELSQTEEGKEKLKIRREKWELFKKKWNIVFIMGDTPVIRIKKTDKK